MQLEKMLDVLRCPKSGTRLTVDGDILVSENGSQYPIVNGKPVLVLNIQALHTTVPSDSIISKNISEYRPAHFVEDPDAIIVHLGCGDVPSNDPRVMSIDILPTSSADIVAEGETLPFATESIDFVESSAVFEHLYNPILAASEVRRVLKEGGRFVVDTAFMQTYHGVPSHYFNMTPQAVETFIISDFILEASKIPKSGTPLYSILNIMDRFIESLPNDQAKRIKGLRLEDALNEMRRDPSWANPMLEKVTPHIRRSLAASVKVLARKPAGYSKKHRDDAEALAVRREYYAARCGLFDQHGQAEFYERCAREFGSENVDPIPSLQSLLAISAVSDPMDLAQYKIATSTLQSLTNDLIESRNRWITEYLTLKK